ncbi:MAG: hypothetical protein ABIK67_06410 [candidate division WOR-3 bacterium]
MAHAYTPGLKVTERTLVRKDRRLPLSGEVLVSVGQKVAGNDVVARTALPGNVTTLNVAGLLGVPPEDITGMMLKKVGEQIEKGEVIAQSKGFFGLFKSAVRSPIKGTIESVSEITGQVILREPPQPVEVTAYIDGEVVEVYPTEGVLVETIASLVQGIFGIGGETRGELLTVVNSPNDVLTASEIDEKCKDKIIIGGSLCDFSALEKAKVVGAKGIVVGGIEDETLKKFLGYELGVAITGSEKVGLTLVITEGFGRMRMADHTFRLLSSLNGKIGSMNGATQIRAGVIRPEVIVPCEDKKGEIKSSITEGGLAIGMPVRIIRQPYFGLLGKVTALPVDLQTIETESKVRVLEVELENGKRILLPRANVEIIES